MYTWRQPSKVVSSNQKSPNFSGEQRKFQLKPSVSVWNKLTTGDSN